MDALDLLKQQHTEVDELFEEYGSCGPTAYRTKEKVFLRIADDLAAHATIEEQLFYPRIKEADEELVRESLEEHLAVKRIIADLLDMAPEDAQYDSKVEVLKEMVQHHVKEEEKELFPQVRKALPAAERKSLGEEMEALFDQLQEREPRKVVPGEIDEAPPLE